MRERSYNGFKFIQDRELEQKLFHKVDNQSTDGILMPERPNSSLFEIDPRVIQENKEYYVSLVKKLASPRSHEAPELFHAECSILKQFYQSKGHIILNSEDIVFIYFETVPNPPGTDQQIDEVDDLFFFKERKKKGKLFKKIGLDGIREIQRRRFLSFKTCLEVFLLDNSSYLFKFKSTEDRDGFAKKILKQRGHRCSNLRYYDSLDPAKIIKKREITDRWRQWRISNFQYLMTLNFYAGRSHNDLSQQPVFPWIFSDYQTQPKDNDYQEFRKMFHKFYQRGDAPPEIFRDLSKNMVLLGSAERQAEFKRKYEDADGFVDIDDRFHSGSHYSNPAIVLHYMARISPYIDALVELQGMHHDNPDRIFHSLEESYRNALHDHADVREITAEFFFLPEMHVNLNKIKFGKRQDNQEVEDVQLPYWCSHNPYRFVVLTREALESNYVSQNLNKWIDYIFGYKQLGVDAERSLNTYSNVTYEDKIDLHSINEANSGLAQSYKLQMYNYGQTPSHVLHFKLKEHPSKKYREEIFKYNLVCDQQVNLKVYRPVNNRKNNQGNHKAII